MQLAVQLALDNVNANTGGPFGAVVVKDGAVIGVGQNQVTKLNDPTAHAEVQAIREACHYLNSYQLEGCEIYTSCEPCPMCLGAIYWARPKAMYFSSTKEEAAKIGFDDQFIYEQLMIPHKDRQIPMTKLEVKTEVSPFQTWERSTQKVSY
ncbi:nucleoside deaminase [Mesobacillus maritimus]|uniref:nucleoside deaminase n=1 Tax=Mesobacillus maritimus TaxID=1643336 RepID=UPI00203ABC8E|nr:nucleoside deaminase [Mesobacillus maritimus]MCM3672040.1 nucleoside deaminase [Mesobacillus maritimus]